MNLELHFQDRAPFRVAHSVDASARPPLEIMNHERYQCSRNCQWKAPGLFSARVRHVPVGASPRPPSYRTIERFVFPDEGMVLDLRMTPTCGAQYAL